MAQIATVLALIESHYNQDARFGILANQIAANERNGETATKIRNIITRNKDKARKLPPDLVGLLQTETPNVRLESLIVDAKVSERVNAIISEYNHRAELAEKGLKHCTKVLLLGPPGTGKTMTAKIVATELGLPLATIQIDGILKSLMGESSAMLRKVFTEIEATAGVYLFDEFDSIGFTRNTNNMEGEVRRILDSFLQLMDQHEGESIIIGATNMTKSVDRALLRRFDDVIEYGYPNSNQRDQLFSKKIGELYDARYDIWIMKDRSEGLSQADIEAVCLDARKHEAINGTDNLYNFIINAIDSRKRRYRLGEIK